MCKVHPLAQLQEMQLTKSLQEAQRLQSLEKLHMMTIMKLANLRWRNQALPKSHLNLRELLSDTNCARLTEDGKRIQCLYCGSTPKLDKSKRTAEGHLKYFRSVHNCKQVKGLKENMKEISEYLTIPGQKSYRTSVKGLKMVLRILGRFILLLYFVNFSKGTMGMHHILSI